MKALSYFVPLCTALSLFSFQAWGSTFTAKDVALHSSKADCWVIIDNKIYDVTTYIDKHPAPTRTIADLCGQDASVGWNTKGTKGKPHSRKAAVLLKSYLKGDLAKTAP